MATQVQQVRLRDRLFAVADIHGLLMGKIKILRGGMREFEYRVQQSDVCGSSQRVRRNKKGRKPSERDDATMEEVDHLGPINETEFVRFLLLREAPGKRRDSGT